MGTGWVAPRFMNDAQPYIPFMSDAHMGLWLMIFAVIGIGILYGFQLYRYGNRKPLRFPKMLWVALFVYYVGSLTHVSSQLLIGPDAFLAYAMKNVAVGLACTAVATFLCVILFRFLEITQDILRKILRATGLWFDARARTMKGWFDERVENYYHSRIEQKKPMTEESVSPVRRIG